MQVIGFNFTKFFAEKPKDFKPNQLSTNIEFTDVTEEQISLLKDSLALKIAFSYSVSNIKSEKDNKKSPEIILNGEISLAVNKEEEKEIIKSWKKKELPDKTKISLINLVLKKCAPKAVYLADEVSLPSPIPYPKITAAKKQ